MAITANKDNVVKRSSVSRKLTYLELDTNWQELINSIIDLTTIEAELSNKVSTSVYNAKMQSLDSSIDALNQKIIDGIDPVIVSPNGTRYLLTVSDTGVLGTVAL